MTSARRAWCVAVAIVTGCGRVAFDPLAGRDARAIGDGFATDVPTPTGLVGRWKLDEGAGTVAADSSGFADTGNFVGAPTWASGHVGNALEFPGDGTSAFLDVPDAAQLQLPQSWSIAAWVKVVALPAAGNYDTIACKSTAGGFANYNLLVDNGHVTTGAGFMIAYNGSGTGSCGIANAKSGAPSLGTWTHVAAVYDQVAQNLALYIDGTQVALTDQTSCAPSHTGAGEDFTIGTEYGGGTTELSGLVDDVQSTIARSPPVRSPKR